MAWETTDTIAVIAAIIALGSLGISFWAIHVSKKQAQGQKEQTQKLTLIDLHSAWQEIHMLNPQAPTTPQALKALAAMQLAASMWVNEIGDKEVLRQHLEANQYTDLYNAFKICEKELPGTGKSGKSFLTNEMGILFGELTHPGE